MFDSSTLNLLAFPTVVLPLELVAASFTIRFWDPDRTIDVAVWISIFGLGVIILNLFPMGYGIIIYFSGSHRELI